MCNLKNRWRQLATFLLHLTKILEYEFVLELGQLKHFIWNLREIFIVRPQHRVSHWNYHSDLKSSRERNAYFFLQIFSFSARITASYQICENITALIAVSHWFGEAIVEASPNLHDFQCDLHDLQSGQWNRRRVKAKSINIIIKTNSL